MLQIKEENIIDSHAVGTEANVVTSLQIKERKTHLLFVFDLKIDRRMRLCVIIKSTKLIVIIGLRAMNGLENVKYYFQAFIPLKQLVNSHVTLFTSEKSTIS